MTATTYTKPAPKRVVRDDPSTWSNVQPEWMLAAIEGEPVIGWKPETVRLADGTSAIDHYVIITATGYYEADVEGVLYRAAVLHPVVAS